MSDENVGALTDRELSKALGVTVRTLRNWRRKGLAPASIKVGRTCRTPQSSYLQWAVEHRNTEVAP